MAAPTTTDQYDEYVAKVITGDLARVDSWNLGLYNDATDTITSTDDIGAITTEPSGGNYSTKTIALSTDSTVVVGLDSTIDIADQTWSSLTFSSTTNVDAFYLSCSVQLEGEGSATEHLMAVGLLDTTYDLSGYTQFTAADTGITHSQA